MNNGDKIKIIGFILFAIISAFFIYEINICLKEQKEYNVIEGKVNYIETTYHRSSIVGINKCYYIIDGYAFRSDYNELVYAYQNDYTVVVTLSKFNNEDFNYIEKVTILECD